jgi:Zn-dependent protease
MIKAKEALIIVSTIIVLAFAIALIDLKNLFLNSLLYMTIIVGVNILSKKAISYYLDTEIEIKSWEIKRFWYRKHDYLKKPIPIGLILPILIKVISVGFVNWTASLTYEVKAKIYRVAKRHGLYAFTDISETQIGVIAAAGIGMNLILALISYLAGTPELAKLSLTFALFNLIPISELDGNKIFFGSLALWVFLASITLLAFLGSLLII